MKNTNRVDYNAQSNQNTQSLKELGLKNLNFITLSSLGGYYPMGLDSLETVLWDDNEQCECYEITRVSYEEDDYGVSKILELKRDLIIMDSFWDHDINEEEDDCSTQCPRRINGLKLLDQSIDYQVNLLAVGRRNDLETCQTMTIITKAMLTVLRVMALEDFAKKTANFITQADYEVLQKETDIDPSLLKHLVHYYHPNLKQLYFD